MQGKYYFSGMTNILFLSFYIRLTDAGRLYFLPI